MSDADFMRWVVMRALQNGSITLQQALAALNAIDAGTFIPANFPVAVAALQAVAAFLTNINTVTIPAMIAQAQNLQTSQTAI